MKPSVVTVVLLFCFLTSPVSAVREFGYGRHRYYDHALAEILVRYASAVYLDDSVSLLNWNCTRCHGLVKNFHLTALVVDKPRSLQASTTMLHCKTSFESQAFVGADETLNGIVIAFRGTQEDSLTNWMEDLYFRELDLNYPGTA